MFFKKTNKKKKRAKKKKSKADLVRRNTIINEARKKHFASKNQRERLRKKDGLTFGGAADIDPEEKDMELARYSEKNIQISGRALEKLKKRQKSLAKSRNTHLSRLQAARGKAVQKSRT